MIIFLMQLWIVYDNILNGNNKQLIRINNVTYDLGTWIIAGQLATIFWVVKSCGIM